MLSEVAAGRIHRELALLVIEGVKAISPGALRGGEAALSTIKAAGADGAPLDAYRDLLERVLAYDGGKTLLASGKSLKTAQHPFLFVLLNSETPLQLVEKEERLMRYLHSRHRIELEEFGSTYIQLRHSAPDSTPPRATEDLAACGQHIALLEEIGCRRLRCRFPSAEEPQQWIYLEGAIQAPKPGGSYARWRFEWSEFVPTRRPMAGLDALLFRSAAAPELEEEGDLQVAFTALVRQDLARSWKLAEVADALNLSPRTLQRRLKILGTSHTGLIEEIRNDEAARLLQSSELTVTEIGYLCGFADTAHFSRSFKRRRGLAPGGFRAQQRTA